MINKLTTSFLFLLIVLIININCFCYRKQAKQCQIEELNLTADNYSLFICVRTKNIEQDLVKVPKNETESITFTLSTIPKITNNLFENKTDKLIHLEICSSDLEDIEDNSFAGLNLLKRLDLPGNKLTTVKTIWFLNTPNLKILNLRDNRLKLIQQDLFLNLKNLEEFDLRDNELLSLPNDFMINLPKNMEKLHLSNNPLYYKQMYNIYLWTISKNNTNDLIKHEYDYLNPIFVITKDCINDTAVVDKSDMAIDKCVEDKLNVELLKISS